MNPPSSMLLNYFNKCKDKNSALKKNNINISDNRNISMKPTNSSDIHFIQFITYNGHFNLKYPKYKINNSNEIPDVKHYSTIYANPHKIMRKFIKEKTQKPESKLIINKKFLELNENIRNIKSKIQLINSKSKIQNKTNYNNSKISTDDKKTISNQKFNNKYVLSDKKITQKYLSEDNNIHLKLQRNLNNSFDNKLENIKQCIEKFSKTLINTSNDRNVVKRNIFIDGIIDNVNRKIEVNNHLNKNITTEYVGNLLSDEMNNIKENNFNRPKNMKEIFKDTHNSLNFASLFSLKPEPKNNDLWNNKISQIFITPNKRFNNKFLNESNKTHKDFNKTNLLNICIDNYSNKNNNRPSQFIIEISDDIEKRFKMKSVECQAMFSKLPNLNNNYNNPILSTSRSNNYQNNKNKSDLSSIGKSKKSIKLKNTSTECKLINENNKNGLFSKKYNNNQLASNEIDINGNKFNDINNPKELLSTNNKKENEIIKNNIFNKRNAYTKNNDNINENNLNSRKNSSVENAKTSLNIKTQTRNDLQKQDLNTKTKNMTKKNLINVMINPADNINNESSNQKKNNSCNNNKTTKNLKLKNGKVFKSMTKSENNNEKNKNNVNEAKDGIGEKIDSLKIIIPNDVLLGQDMEQQNYVILIKKELNLPEIKIRKCKSLNNDLMRHKLKIRIEVENFIKNNDDTKLLQNKRRHYKINSNRNMTIDLKKDKNEIRSRKLFYDRIDIVNEIRKFDALTLKEREEFTAHGLEYIFLSEKKNKTQIDLIRIKKEKQKIITFIEKYLEHLQIHKLNNKDISNTKSILKLKLFKKYKVLDDDETKEFENLMKRIMEGDIQLNNSIKIHGKYNKKRRKKYTGRDKYGNLIYDNSYLFKKIPQENYKIKEEILAIINSKFSGNIAEKRKSVHFGENTSNYSNNYSNHSNDTSNVSASKKNIKKRFLRRNLKVIKEGKGDGKNNKKDTKEDEMDRIQQEKERKIEEDKKRREEIYNKRLYDFFEKVQYLVKNYNEKKISELIAERIKDNADTIIFEKETRKKNFFNNLQMNRQKGKTFERHKEKNIGFNSPLTFRTTNDMFFKSKQ